MLVDDSVHVIPVVGEIESERVTVPVKPCTEATVIVDVPAVLSATLTGLGLAETVKSWNVKVTVVELVVAPLVAVTVSTSTSPTVSVHVRVEVPLVPSVTLVGLSVQVELPVEATVSATVPVNPPRAVTVIVEVPPVVPAFAVTVVGLALMSIPGATAAVNVADIVAVLFVIRLFVPPVPVIVRV